MTAPIGGNSPGNFRSPTSTGNLEQLVAEPAARRIRQASSDRYRGSDQGYSLEAYGIPAAPKQPDLPSPLPSRRQQSDADFVTDLYRRVLGREPDPEGFAAHMKGLQQGHHLFGFQDRAARQRLVATFLNSPEYHQLQAKAAMAGSGDGSAPHVAPAPLVGPVPLEGYDSGKLNDASHQTPKYLFGRVASHYPLDSVHDKASAEALLNRMVPDMRAAGLEIAGVRGDKIEVKTDLGYEWVDVVARSGANPGWWWGSEGKGTPSPT